ncbi:MAG: hypothetical protein CVU26_09430 [Betaproteobacteria bacterium HGW-Betaproteobacteria-2]|nr:MAG: hypothetical protein CVU26_09430 [Betaproteobacteria bacterium HGW-Betaproteobacteria-2]
MFSQAIHRLESPGLDGRVSFFCLIHCLLFLWMTVLIPVVPILDGPVYVCLLIALVQAIAESRRQNWCLKLVYRRITQTS